MKVWRSAVVQTSRYRGTEVWRLDAGVATWRHGVLERWRRVSHGAPELRSSGGAL